MKCTVCGATLKSVNTNLPFKIRDATIVILKNLPTLQCSNCSEYLIEDEVLTDVDRLLAEVNSAAELEVIAYAG